MLKIKYIIIGLTLVALGGAMYFTNTLAQNTNEVSLANDQLLIIPLYNYLGSGLGVGGKWSIVTIYEKGNHHIFAVLPIVGGFLSPSSAPYSWSLDDPTIGTLKPLYKGVAVEVLPQKVGETTLRVTDRKGLQGAVLIQTSNIGSSVLKKLELTAPELTPPPQPEKIRPY